MFEDVTRAPGPRSASVVERGLRRWLDSPAGPDLLLAGRDRVLELAEDFRGHGRYWLLAAATLGPDAARGADGGPADGGLAGGDGPAAAAGCLPEALVWDAQFSAGAEFLTQVRAAQAGIGREEARRARALAGFARSRPVAADRPDAEVGAAAAASRAARPAVLAAVSEWAVDEVAVALSVTGEAASRLLTESLQLVTLLPGTLAALEGGVLSWGHVRVMAEVVAPLPAGVRAEAEERLLARVAGRTPAQLRAAVHRVVARLDAEAVTRRVAAAVRERRVAVYPGTDGMATVAATLPMPVARAVHDALGRYADAAAVPGDERTRAQRTADCLVELVLRPAAHGLPPVQARLTVVAAVQTLLGEDEPGEVDGDLVPAPVVRQLAATLGLLPEDMMRAPQERQSGTTSTGTVPTDTVPRGGASGDVGGSVAQEALAELLMSRQVAGTALEHLPQLALVDELTGALACLTDAALLRTAARTGRGLGPPPDSPGYRPRPAVDRFVRHRDRRCRFPGCRARPARCDLDHTTPWPAGPTSVHNLTCLCRHHHRLRHQAPGWTLTAGPDGGLRWTTPTGQQATTHPPRHGTDDDGRVGAPDGPGTPRAPAARPEPDPAHGWADDPAPF